MVIAGASPAAAAVCSPNPIVCITPSAGLVNKQTVQVIVKGPASTEIAVTECNSNIESQDPDACNQNPSDLNHAGGPALAMTNAAGKAVLEYRVLVSTTRPVGDGNCLPGGDTSEVPCFLIAASVSSEMPVANPTPFFTG
jgi:hypothetical protein